MQVVVDRDREDHLLGLNVPTVAFDFNRKPHFARGKRSWVAPQISGRAIFGDLQLRCVSPSGLGNLRITRGVAGVLWRADKGAIAATQGQLSLTMEIRQRQTSFYRLAVDWTSEPAVVGLRPGRPLR